jgi:capsular polysaccharide transport system permease protein
VTALRSQLRSLQEQLVVERRRSTSDDKHSDRLNALAIEFQTLQLQAEIALDAYKIALSATEIARVESTRKIKSLVVIEPPSTPEKAEYPRRLYNLLTLLVGSLLILAVVQLVLATIREHQD